MDHLVEEFRHLSGVGPSLLEKTSADPMLGVLAKAFSVKALKPADVKYLLYRKVGHGVELEDRAEKFGGILTSVEAKEADPKALVAFLKKHGAKPAPKVESVEPLGEKRKGKPKRMKDVRAHQVKTPSSAVIWRQFKDATAMLNSLSSALTLAGHNAEADAIDHLRGQVQGVKNKMHGL